MGRACRWASVVLPVLALALTATLLFYDLLPLPVPSRYLAGDFAAYSFPVVRYVAAEIAAGRLPHWTPYLGVGYPLMADIEASVLYPPIRLLTLVTGPPSYLALELYAVAHYLLAGMGMLLLGRLIGLSVVASSLGAIVFMCSGFLWAHSAHLTIIQSAAWLPWLVIAHARTMATASPMWAVVAAGMFAGSILGGHPQIAFYAGFAVVLHCVVEGEPRRRASWSIRLWPPISTATIVLLGLAFAAPQLMPTLSLARTTSRWNPSQDFLAFDALPADQLLTLVVPFAYFGTERFQSLDEFFAYAGIGALILAGVGMTLGRDRWSRFFTLLTVGGLALALAPAIPGYIDLVRHVPVFGLFRAAARATLLFDFGVAGLAACGLKAWEVARREPTDAGRVRGLRWSLRLIAALALVGYLLVRQEQMRRLIGPVAVQFPEFYAHFLVLLLAHVLVLELWYAGRLPATVAALVTIGIVLIDLNHPDRALQWAVSPPEQAWQPTPVVGRIRAEHGRYRVWNEGRLHRRGGVFEDNAGLVDRIEVLSHYTSLSTVRFDDFTRALHDPWHRPVLVDLLNVRYLVLPEDDDRPRQEPTVGSTLGNDPGLPIVPLLGEALPRSSSRSEPSTPGAPFRDAAAAFATSVSIGLVRSPLAHARAAPDVRADRVAGGRYQLRSPNLWENIDVLPRAFLVERVVVEPDPRRVMATLDTVDPRQTAVVERAPDCVGSLIRSGPPPGNVELIEYGSTRVRLRADHRSPAFLVLADAHHREWRVTVDGVRTRLYHTDLVLRGVCVPAGHHEVDFRYQPSAFHRGVAIALVSTLVAVTAIVGARRFPARRVRGS